MSLQRPVFALLLSFSWQEIRHHPWRNAAAVVAVTLGVALAFAVHVINASALQEFSKAMRMVNGRIDISLQAPPGGSLSDAAYAELINHDEVALLSPILEVDVTAFIVNKSTTADHTSHQDIDSRFKLKVLGLDAIAIAAMQPELMPITNTLNSLAIFAPDTLFLNARASQPLEATDTLTLLHGAQLHSLRIAGHHNANGPPTAVMDIAAAQDLFNQVGQFSRIDIRLKDPEQRAKFIKQWPQTLGGLWVKPADQGEQLSQLSQAYRVNLTVLALVALFTGSFLVYSVLGLSVARRAQQFALLAVMGLRSSERGQLVLCEAAVLGLVGSFLGLLLGGLLAFLALSFLGGDLGGGYFSGEKPSLLISWQAAVVFGLLGIVCAVAGAWWPARSAAQLPPAQTLKGLQALTLHKGFDRAALVYGLLIIGAACVLAIVPPIWDIPVAAYISVALLLLGGIRCIPWLVGLVVDHWAPLVQQMALPLLAIERARRSKQSASMIISGIVAALSLAIALTVMVASFRASMLQWLDVVLPADVYVRISTQTSDKDSTGTSASTPPNRNLNFNHRYVAPAYFEPSFLEMAAQSNGVIKMATQRSMAIRLEADRPNVTLLIRSTPESLQLDTELPLIQKALPIPEGAIGIYVSEAMVDLYGARIGSPLTQLGDVIAGLPFARQPHATENLVSLPPFFVAGVWRDYARQFGTIIIAAHDFAKLNSDGRVNDLSFWISPGISTDTVQSKLRLISQSTQTEAISRRLEFGSSQSIRARTLQIFDRSFAVTYWLQAIAIGIGLFGVAASFSAQILARRKEFGLLVHLGLKKNDILKIIAMEGFVWTCIGVVAGIILGLAVALILVKVVNPQSFHWSMDLSIPWHQLGGLSLAVIAAGTITAYVAGRSAASPDAVLAVKEDW